MLQIIIPLQVDLVMSSRYVQELLANLCSEQTQPFTCSVCHGLIYYVYSCISVETVIE